MHEFGEEQCEDSIFSVEVSNLYFNLYLLIFAY